MPTPIYLTGFEHGAPFTTNGTGLYSAVAGTWAMETTTIRSGLRSAKGSPISSTACNIRSGKSVAGVTGVQRFFVRFNTLPAGSVVIDIAGIETSPSTSNPSIGFNPTTGFFEARVGGTGKQEDNVTVAINTWYRVDFKAVITGGNMVVDVKIDGRTITQVVVATTATSLTNGFLGTLRTDHLVAWDYFFDDWLISATSGDYPIGRGAVQILKPSSDGTHSAGTNTMEDNAGTDIGVTTAYNKLNSVPPDATTYIRQATIGTGNYAEVLFEDITAPHDTIVGAMAILAYTAATTTADTGGCIVSKDSFSTSTTVWGATGALSDYSDGSTANLFFKTAIIAGAISKDTVNALKARVGYSGDITPNPYWIDLLIEVAYTPPLGKSSNILQAVNRASTY